MKKDINKNISDEKAFSIIKKTLMTEKSTNLNQYNQYSFIVSKDSCSNEIKKAIEKIFKVKVTKVNTSVMRGKLKSFKGNLGYKTILKRRLLRLLRAIQLIHLWRLNK